MDLFLGALFISAVCLPGFVPLPIYSCHYDSISFEYCDASSIALSSRDYVNYLDVFVLSYEFRGIFFCFCHWGFGDESAG